jgi:CHAT domain-containing protein
MVAVVLAAEVKDLFDPWVGGVIPAVVVVAISWLFYERLGWRRIAVILTPFFLLSTAQFLLPFYIGQLWEQASLAGKRNMGYEQVRLSVRAARYHRITHGLFASSTEKAFYSITLSQVSMAYELSGDFPKSLDYAKKALATARAAGRRDQGLPLKARATAHATYSWLLRYVDPYTARRHFLEAIKLVQPPKHLEPSIELSLASLSISAGDADAALEHTQAAGRAMSGSDSEILCKQAEALLMDGRLAEAESALQKAKNLPGAPDREYFFELFRDREAYPRVMTDLLLKKGEFEEARSYVFGIYIPIKWPFMWSTQSFVEYYARMGWIAEGQGEIGNAIGLFITCIQRLETYRRHLPEGFRPGFLSKEIFTVPYRHLASILANLSPDQPPLIELPEYGKMIDLRRYGKTNLEAALYFAEATKSRTFLDQVASTGRILVGQIPEDLKTREQGLLHETRQRRADWQRAVVKAGYKPSQLGEDLKFTLADAPKRVVTAYQALDKIQARWRRFENELYMTHPRYAATNYPRPVPLDMVPLQDDEIVVEYALADLDSHAFVLEKDRSPQVIRFEASKDEITNLVARYLEPLSSGRLAPDPQVGRRLSEMLLTEVLRLAAPDKRLVLIPDGALWTLPFDMLPDLEGGRGAQLVGDVRRISYAPSLSVLALNRMLPGPEPSQPFLGLADPAPWADRPKLAGGVQASGVDGGPALRGVYIGRSIYEFPPLLETRSEVEEAARTFGIAPNPPNVLVGEEATETRFKTTKLVSYRIIHFATHGVANNDLAQVREPALILASDSANDGLLRASEVMGLRLGPALVVLAACKTGLGEEKGGDGVMSMARAFHQAGAKTVVMSLWSVPSRASQELFRVFYSELASGRPVGDSLRQAKRKVRATYPEPFYWAGFVTVGEDS